MIRTASIISLFCLLPMVFALAAPKLQKPPTQIAPSAPPIVQTASVLFDRATDLYNAGEFAKAVLLYRKAEGRGADPGIVAFNIGNCLYRLNRIPEAAASFKRAVRHSDGEYAPALFNLASALFRLEQYGECIAAYRRGLRKEPLNLGAWLYLADAYTRTGDRIGAQSALEKARALEPGEAAIIYQLAEVHVALKETETAIALIREAYAQRPEEVDFLFYIGDLYLAMGSLGEAAAAYREGLTLKPRDTEVMYKLADVLARDGKPFLAMEYLQKALAEKPSYSDAAVFLGNLAFDAKWEARAEGAYLTALEAGNREGLEGLRNLAYEYYRKGFPQKAAGLLEKAVPFRPKDSELAREIEQYRELEALP